jgi:chorismate mutase
VSGHCDFCGIWHSGSCCHPGRAELDALRAALATATARAEKADAEREAAVLAMREACAGVAQAMIEESWTKRHYAESHGVANERTSMTRAVSAMAERIRSLPTPTSALDAERERVVREAVRWCYEHPAKRTTNDKCEAEKMDSLDAYLARALAAAKGGQDG